MPTVLNVLGFVVLIRATGDCKSQSYNHSVQKCIRVSGAFMFKHRDAESQMVIIYVNATTAAAK